MEKSAGSGIAGEQGRAAGGKDDKATPPSSSSPAPRRRMKDMTPAEQQAALVFFDAAMDDLEVYMAMTEDDVEEEYRRAGKLHKYDPDMELNKRYARIAKKYPPPHGLVPEMEQYLKLIEDEED